jgi:hypothetical protein
LARGRAPLTGTYDKVAATAGFEPEAPDGVYEDTTGAEPSDPVHVDPEAAALIGEWFTLGDSALCCSAPDVLPEHFDLSSTFEEVNYGVSPGDAAHPGPYAYVSPWTPRTGDFWNVSFGALRPREEVNTVASLLEFFEEGKAEAARSAVSR